MLDVKNVSMSCPLCPQRTKQNYLLHNPLSNYYTTLSTPDRKLRSPDQGHLVQHTATYNIIKHHQTSLACLEECQSCIVRRNSSDYGFEPGNIPAQCLHVMVIGMECRVPRAQAEPRRAGPNNRYLIVPTQ